MFFRSSLVLRFAFGSVLAAFIEGGQGPVFDSRAHGYRRPFPASAIVRGGARDHRYDNPPLFYPEKTSSMGYFYDVGTVLKGGIGEYYSLMKESVILSLFLLGFIVVFGVITPWLQLWLILWCVAPAVAFLISRPIGGKNWLAKKDVPFVRTVAYRNALYFLENAKEETHWLIPDHVQEYPKLPETSRVATSPTNIGAHVIALVSAFDLGYISPLRYADRTEKLFSSLARLYRYRGHLINWYDIKKLERLVRNTYRASTAPIFSFIF